MSITKPKQQELHLLSAGDGLPALTMADQYKRKRGEIMKVKVIKRKKSPAPFIAEQAVEKIPENEFIRIIDNLHYLVHNRIVKNAEIKMFPDLKISEYKDKFNF